MPQSASIEADEYSRWGVDELDADDVEIDARAGANTRADATSGSPGIVVLVADPEVHGERLDKWLASRLPDYSRGRIQRWIADGHVTIDDRVAAVRDPVYAGDRVSVAPQLAAVETAFVAEDVPLVVVHEDEALLVIDKSAGLVVHPAAGNWSGTVLNGLLHRVPSLATIPRAGIVHRLDKDTTGLMVVAKTLAAQTDLVRQLQARTVARTYVAIVHGTPPPTGRVDRPIGRDPRDRTRMKSFAPDDDRAVAKPAATRFETLASVEVDGGRPVSLLRCRLETGRTHQIRVHLQAIGHPLMGDPTYGPARPPSDAAFPRQALHAWRLGLLHPGDGRPMRWQASPPADFVALAGTLGLDLAVLPTE